MAAGAEPRGRGLRQGLLILGLLALIALAGAGRGAADIISTSGNLVLGVSSGNVCNLTANGLGIGTITPSANLHVAGNAVVSGALVAGGTGNTSGSNLHINGSLGFSVQSVSGNTTLSGNSVVLADASSGNITLTLPSPSAANGRVYMVKKTGNTNNVWLGSNALIDGWPRLALTTGGAGLPHVQVVSNGNTWLVIGGNGFAATTLDPLSLSPSLWLDAADASTLFDATSGGNLVAADGAVARWEDKSGSANHATQPTAGSRPLRRAAAVNGRDAVDGLGSRFMDLTSALGSPHTVFCVFRRTAAATRQFPIARKSASALYGPCWFTDNHLYFGPTTVGYLDGGANAGTGDHILSGVSNGAASGLYLDGLAVATGSLGTSGGGYDEIMTRNSGAGEALQGYLCEIILYPSALSSSDRVLVERYLGTKWGVSVP